MTQPAQDRPPILIILPVHNRRATTALFIRCLRAQTYTNWHLLLIDDGPTDGTADMVRSEISKLTVLCGIGSWWWAGALHQGYRWLGARPGDGTTGVARFRPAIEAALAGRTFPRGPEATIAAAVVQAMRARDAHGVPGGDASC